MARIGKLELNTVDCALRGLETLGGRVFTREELQHIRDAALEESRTVNESWRIILHRLANAADHLDANIARTEVRKGD